MAAGLEAVTRPAVQFEPGMRFGGPHMRGIGTDPIAGLFLAEKDAAAVADDYGLTLHELWVVLWFEGTHGEYRAELGEWARSVYWQLARGEIDGIAAPDV